jgi:hypothetical protein
MNSVGWIRSTRARTLLWAALVMSLGLGAAFVAVGVTEPKTPDARATPLTDASAVAQVVGSARQIAGAAHLQHASGGYSFVSCTNDNDPPYQAALFMSFELPQQNPAGYLHDVATAMIADGWVDAPATGENFGEKLTKDGVTSVFYRNPSKPEFAAMRLYGQCRTTADHRNDNPVWTEARI